MSKQKFELQKVMFWFKIKTSDNNSLTTLDTQLLGKSINLKIS
jgi:hypothetical protein